VTITFKGRAVLPGATKGKVLVTQRGFNTYASFSTSIHSPKGKAICADSGNPELYGKDLAYKIICLPMTTGSTSSGGVWQWLAKMGILPKAMLFSEQIDSLAAGGLIVADIWAGKRVITVDQLGNEFFKTVKEGDWIRISEDGMVEIIN
jgi:hypothetical protein